MIEDSKKVLDDLSRKDSPEIKMAAKLASELLNSSEFEEIAKINLNEIVHKSRENIRNIEKVTDIEETIIPLTDLKFNMDYYAFELYHDRVFEPVYKHFKHFNLPEFEFVVKEKIISIFSNELYCIATRELFRQKYIRDCISLKYGDRKDIWISTIHKSTEEPTKIKNRVHCISFLMLINLVMIFITLILMSLGLIFLWNPIIEFSLIGVEFVLCALLYLLRESYRRNKFKLENIKDIVEGLQI